MTGIDRETLLEIRELVKRTGEEAMKEARKHGTYIVYQDKQGNMVKEYPDGRKKIGKWLRIEKDV
ncbi:hypothetical protein [Bacillus sp. FJAT-42315]|uniref:hypothetical protein n=1 Tax=Bacillus sp. FJAT-42315 TaxID=2014077 RepID=UPI000C24788A|nr:hypothetical protein [Bacillus sp. FJAT-42315]